MSNLKTLMADKEVEKLFHFARFDLAMLKHHIGPVNGAVFCTKIASKLCRTYTDRHSLLELCRRCWDKRYPNNSNPRIGGQKN